MLARSCRFIPNAFLSIAVFVVYCPTVFCDEPAPVPKEWSDLAKCSPADAEKFPDRHRRDVEIFQDPTSNKPQYVPMLAEAVVTLAHKEKGVLNPLVSELEDNVKWNNG